MSNFVDQSVISDECHASVAIRNFGIEAIISSGDRIKNR